MAKLWYSHFDSTPEDRRLLLAEDWARYIKSFITTGIRNGGTCLQVTNSNFYNVKINLGVANIEGYIFSILKDEADDFHNLELSKPHNQYNRIDRIILRLDRSIQNRKITPEILTGEAKTYPTPPELTRNNIIYEISLAQIYRPANSLNILPANITDERFNEELCGLMNSILGVDSSHWQNQFDEFMRKAQEINDSFLETEENKLSENTERLINELDLLIEMNKTETFLIVNNDWEDWYVKKGLNLTTRYSGNLIIEEFRKSTDNSLVGEKLTEFLPDGKIEEKITFEDWEVDINGNVIKTIKDTVTKITEFLVDGNIKEEIK